jgi:hypothetical protein
MPFKSQAQRRFFYAAAARGDMPRATVRRWETETPKGRKLPEKVMRKRADTPLEEAIEAREDTSRVSLRALAKIRDPEERKRYLADMSAKNHRLAMTRPKTASFDIGIVAALEKVAARSEADEEKRGRAWIGGIGGAAAAPLAGAAAYPINKALMSSVKTRRTPSLNPAEVEKLKGHLKVPKASVHEAKKWEQSMAMGGGRGQAHAPKHSPEFLAHELGHLNLRRNKVRGGLLTAGRVLGGSVGSAAGGAMAAGGEEGSKTVKLAPAVAAAGQMPTLADEAVSSIRGYKALKKTKAMNPAQLKAARRNLAKAFGTYGAAAALSTLPVAALSAMRWKKKDQRK